MSELDLAAIRERAESATPGPWVAIPNVRPAVVSDDGDGYWTDVADAFEEEADAEFVAHAREDVPALLAEVDRLRDAAEDREATDCCGQEARAVKAEAALDRVREIHQDAGESQGYFGGRYEERDHCCSTCGSHGEYGVEWPCRTIRALDGGGPDGE